MNLWRRLLANRQQISCRNTRKILKENVIYVILLALLGIHDVNLYNWYIFNKDLWNIIGKFSASISKEIYQGLHSQISESL